MIKEYRDTRIKINFEPTVAKEFKKLVKKKKTTHSKELKSLMEVDKLSISK